MGPGKRQSQERSVGAGLRRRSHRRLDDWQRRRCHHFDFKPTGEAEADAEHKWAALGIEPVGLAERIDGRREIEQFGESALVPVLNILASSKTLRCPIATSERQ